MSQEGLEELKRLLEADRGKKEMVLSILEEPEEELRKVATALLQEILPRWGVGLRIRGEESGGETAWVFASPDRGLGQKEASRCYQYVYGSWRSPDGGILAELFPSLWEVMIMRSCGGGLLLDKMSSIDGIQEDELSWIDHGRIRGEANVYGEDSKRVIPFKGSPLLEGHEY